MWEIILDHLLGPKCNHQYSCKREAGRFKSRRRRCEDKHSVGFGDEGRGHEPRNAKTQF